MALTGRGQDRSPRARLGSTERRAAILAAAADEFAAAPYDAVATAAIAARADASPALVFRYFGSKAELYAAVVRLSIDELRSQQRARVGALPPNSSTRDRVRAALEATLDHIASHPDAWANPLRGGTEPTEATRLWLESRAEQAAALRTLVGANDSARDGFALTGYVGMVDAMCLRWADGGCDPNARGPLIDAALGGLEGALGDWRR